MADESLEETLDNPSEPVTEDKETVKGEAPKKREYSDLERQMYARAKKAEAELKLAKEELDKKKSANAPDLDAILEITSATAGLEPDEVDELKLRASALGKSLTETRRDKTYNLTLQALREEKRKANALEPSSRQEGSEKRKPLKEQSLSEKEDYLRNLTVNGKKVNMLPTWGNPEPPKRT
jgi:hypothetical protein